MFLSRPIICLSLALSLGACAHAPKQSSDVEPAVKEAPASEATEPAPNIEALQAACDAEDLDACHSAAEVYRDGNGAAQDLPLAVGLFDGACQAGHLVSCNDLGMLHVRGVAPEGRALLVTACEGGYGTACANLGYIYHNGVGVAADADTARLRYDQGCELDGGRTCTALGLILLSEDDVLIARDPAGGVAALGRGCDTGEARACLALGLYHAKGAEAGTPDLPAAAPLFQKACGESGECNELGEGFSRPTAESMIKPTFPQGAKTAGIREAKFKVLVFVDETGNVVAATVVEGSSTYTHSVAAALEQWTFKPATLDGEPLPWVMEQAFVFRLE